MPKNYRFKKLMLELLDENELSKKDLFNEVKSISNISTSDKTLNESLMTLMKQRRVYIVGYDFSVYSGVRRIQSIKSEGLIFGRVKLGFVELNALIKQLESTDMAEVDDAFLKLRNIFKMKVDEVGSENLPNLEKWDDTFNSPIYYIISQREEKKNMLIKRLALALSDEKWSTRTFKDLLVYVDSNM